MLKNLLSVAMVALGVAMFGAAAPAQDAMKFQVEGANPGGKGSYKGEVELTKLSSATAKARWTTGANKEVTEGIAIKTDKAIGAAYGGKDLYALALYSIKGNSIEAVWTTAAAPKESSTYALKGSDFQGALSFADGTPGTVTFTATGENVYKVVWQLTSGRFEGVGVRKGDVLAAASGAKDGSFGVAGYVPKGDIIDGSWAVNGATAAGTEVWSLPGGSTGASAAPVGDGTKVTFSGDTYTLKDKKSAPGQPTAELREYLRDGETFEDYRKMVGLRTHVTKADAATMAKAVLAQVQKEHPNSYVKEIVMQPEAATIFFILVVGNDAELNLWRYQKAENGLASAQFVLRNKAPYETQKKFKAEQDKNFDQWLEEISRLGGQAYDLVTASAGATVAAPTAPATPAKSSSEEISPELVKAIKGDMDKCGKIAMEFMGHLKGGATDKAVALMNDSAFTGTSRDAFAAQLAKSNGVFGELKSFKPDKKSTTFEMKDGLVNFYLHADSEYANATVHEVLRFVKNKAGEIEFVGYNRTAKQ
ncbi:hypothetical protein DES53_106281 [Roseimicrobium gellanilyticum]|uniref:Uncharacterized protein n=1 Tax=Roseimicrobium gellanilyticum TaxID=748857 RepID=A0A366HIT4_9BACT|nr:hypothetical protein [Roseimicrobium gellanilyticum]RBP42572.1 hypothetical protein DES53_106281 [Roseimicrobium gellanilyticum]